MAYAGRVERVASRCSVLPDVALLRRELGEESSPEECGTHTDDVAARQASQRSWHEYFEARSAFHASFTRIGSAYLFVWGQHFRAKPC